MNQEERKQHAMRCFGDAFHTLLKVCPLLKKEFKLQSQDEDTMDFTIDNIPFSIGWGETVEPSIGGMRWVVQFTLSVFHTTWGSRHEPPEVIDTELVTSKSIHVCIRTALLKTFECVMDGALENVGYTILIDKEKEFA